MYTQGDDYLILRGGGLSNFVWTDNLFSAWARPGNYFHVAWARENIFSCKHGKPQSTEAITRLSNVIESSSLRWNYYDKSSFDLYRLCVFNTTKSTALYFSLPQKKKNEKPTSNNLISNHKATVNKDIFSFSLSPVSLPLPQRRSRPNIYSAVPVGVALC